MNNLKPKNITQHKQFNTTNVNNTNHINAKYDFLQKNYRILNMQDIPSNNPTIFSKSMA